MWRTRRLLLDHNSLPGCYMPQRWRQASEPARLQLQCCPSVAATLSNETYRAGSRGASRRSFGPVRFVPHASGIRSARDGDTDGTLIVIYGAAANVGSDERPSLKESALNTIEEAARRLPQRPSSGVDTPLELATRPATPALDVGTEAHEAAAPGPEVLSRLQAQWAGERLS